MDAKLTDAFGWTIFVLLAMAAMQGHWPDVEKPEPRPRYMLGPGGCVFDLNPPANGTIEATPSVVENRGGSCADWTEAEQMRILKKQWPGVFPK